MPIVLTAVVLGACRPAPTASPRTVVIRYLDYLVDRNYEKAYPLLSASFREKYQVKDVMMVTERLRAAGIRFGGPKVTRERIDGDRALVAYSVSVGGTAVAHQGRVFSSEAELRREAEGWRIVKIVALPRAWLESVKQ